MVPLRPTGPDIAPLKDALRGLRHGLKRRRLALERAMPAGLPEPATSVARSLLEDVDQIARGFDQMVSILAGGRAPGELPPVNLRELASSPEGRLRLAGFVYAALKQVLERLGCDDVLVSEAALTRVLSGPAARSIDPASDGSAEAAELTLAFLADPPIRRAAPVAALAGDRLEAVAIFAVLLSLIAERGTADGAELLTCAADLGAVLAEEIATACRHGDGDALRALYRRYARHV